MMNKEQEEIEFNRIKELAEKGDAESQYLMGLDCLYPEDAPPNYKEAEKWLWLEETEGCKDLTSTLCHLDSEKMEIDPESFFSKAEEIQKLFVENGLPMTFL